MASLSLLVVLLGGYFGKRAQRPRVRVDGPLTIVITAVALPLLTMKRVNTVWIIGVAAALSLVGAVTGVAHVRTPERPMLVEQHEATQVSLMDGTRGRGIPSGDVRPRIRDEAIAVRHVHPR